MTSTHAPATLADVCRLSTALPNVEGAPDPLGYGVRRGARVRGFVWSWKERRTPGSPRVPNPDVIAVRVANVAQRDLMIAAEPARFFTEPHYDGFPAVLVRLAAVSVADLEVLLAEGWRCQSPTPRSRRATGDAPAAPSERPAPDAPIPATHRPAARGPGTRRRT